MPPAGRKADGGFVYTPALSSSEIAAQVAQYFQLGFKILVLSSARIKSGGCSSNSYAWTTGNPTNLGAWLTGAAKYGMAVYVGLVESSGTCATWGSDATNRSQDATDLDTTVATILASYGTSPALAGWYVINEASVNYDHADWSTILTYYSTMVTTIRARSSLPILIAPYLASSGTLTTTQTAGRASQLVATGLNIICVQDAVGAGPMSIWSDRTPTVDQYFEQMSGSIGNALWADVEVYTYPTGSFTGTNYAPGPVARVDRQLAATDKAQRRILWLPNHQMGTVDDGRTPEAASLYAAYRAFYGLGGEYVTPVFYAWTVAPTQADSPPRMFDKETGDAKDGQHTTSRWVGFATGVTAEATIDLGAPKLIAWVRAHTLNRTASGIAHPDSMALDYSINGVSYSTAGTIFTNAYSKTDGEYVIGNTAALAIKARYLKVRLVNAAKTWVSEIEVISAGAPGTSTLTPGFSDLVSEHVRG